MIEKLITSQTRRKLLALLFSDEEGRLYLREISRKSKENINAVRKELMSLESIGLVSKSAVANLTYYSLNKDFLLYQELKSMIHKTDPTLLLIKEASSHVKNALGKNLISFVLFGSVARNESTEDSDIDFIAICTHLPADWRKRDALSIELEKIGFERGKSIHIELLTKKEFLLSIDEGAPLLFEISRDHRIIIDNGLFRDNIGRFAKKMEGWGAHKTDKHTWEVPALAVKI